MKHTFLIEPGRWLLSGSWLNRSGIPVLMRGKTLVAWKAEDWFSVVTKLTFPDSEYDEITCKYQGHFDDSGCRYTFVLQHSHLGRIEGEGWVAPQSILQRYWLLGDKQRRTGVDTMFQVAPTRYVMSTAIMAGHHLETAMEVSMERQH